MNKNSVKFVSTSLQILAFFSLFVAHANSHASDKAVGTAPRELDKPTQTNRSVLNCLKPKGHHLSFKEFTCPIGGEKFKNLVIGTHSWFGRHLDGEPVSYLDFPAPLVVCPGNGFIITEEKYSDDELKKLKKVIESVEYKEIFSRNHASYYLFAKQNEMLQERSEDRWWFLLNATWEADECNDSGKYKLYAHEAIDAGKHVLKEIKTGDEKYWRLNVIIPNLYRRIGDFESAQAWIDALDGRLPEEKKQKEYFELAFRLLRRAVLERDSSQIRIEESKTVEK